MLETRTQPISRQYLTLVATLLPAVAISTQRFLFVSEVDIIMNFTTVIWWEVFVVAAAAGTIDTSFGSAVVRQKTKILLQNITEHFFDQEQSVDREAKRGFLKHVGGACGHGQAFLALEKEAALSDWAAVTAHHTNRRNIIVYKLFTDHTPPHSVSALWYCPSSQLPSISSTRSEFTLALMCTVPLRRLTNFYCDLFKMGEGRTNCKLNFRSYFEIHGMLALHCRACQTCFHRAKLEFRAFLSPLNFWRQCGVLQLPGPCIQ